MRRRITYHITTTDEHGGQTRSTEHYGVFRKWQQAALRTNLPFVCQRDVDLIPDEKKEPEDGHQAPFPLDR